MRASTCSRSFGLRTSPSHPYTWSTIPLMGARCVGFVAALLGAALVGSPLSADPATDVVVNSDLAYGAAVNVNGVLETLRLDTYDPVDEVGDSGPRPVIVLVHGGGFYQYDKADPLFVTTATALARQGYFVVSVNYRLRRDTYPNYPVASLDAQHDVQAAVRWLRANSVELNLDGSRLAVIGHSAGAITGLRVATRPDDVGDSGTPGESSVVQAVLSLSGFLPIEVGVVTTDVLMLHGARDNLVPIAWAEDTCSRWEAAGGDCNLVSFPGGMHDPAGFFDPESGLVTDFLTCQLGGTISFSDVAVGSPAVEAVAWAKAQGIPVGFADGTFRPRSAMTRARFAEWLWALMGRPSTGTPVTFPDVAATARVAPAVSWVATQGIMSERADGRFGRNEIVNRASAAGALWRLAGRPAGAPASGIAGLDPGAPYARAVDWMVATGLTSAFEDASTFSPRAPLHNLHLVRMLRDLSFDVTAWAEPPGPSLCFGP